MSIHIFFFGFQSGFMDWKALLHTLDRRGKRHESSEMIRLNYILTNDGTGSPPALRYDFFGAVGRWKLNSGSPFPLVCDPGCGRECPLLLGDRF